ncbi:hypothetical protein LSAT2_009970 [Lamellibrachia satsuma]|nr:hypothetical protein LSAT2_009970 [Lamellibrachia satsuma]
MSINKKQKTSLEELEIEGLLEQHPGVVEVTVRDTSAVTENGRRVTAFVVLKPGYRDMRSDQLAQYVRWNLPSPARFKVRVIIVDRIPWSSKFHEIEANNQEEHSSFL